MRNRSVWLRGFAAVALVFAGTEAHSQQFVPPAGYTGNASLPGVASQAEPDAPKLDRVPDATLSNRFVVDPAYPRPAHVKVVGAFDVVEPAGTHLVAAWTDGGFLPVTLSFSDGRCFSLTADYIGGTLSNGHLTRTSCEGRRTLSEPPPPTPPDRSLRLAGLAWGYSAWVSGKTGTTVVTAPHVKTFQPLFTAHMKTVAIMAMNGPDWPGGNVTLVGRLNGRLMVVTLEVGW